MTGSEFGPQTKRRALMTEMRVETDSFGPLDVPADKLWGAQTARSLKNFKIGGQTQPLPLIRALGIVKHCAAKANMALDNMDGKLGEAIAAAAADGFDAVSIHGNKSQGQRDRALRVSERLQTVYEYRRRLQELFAARTLSQERLVHSLWAERRYDGKDLQTTDGRRLTILAPGILNDGAGPDFRDARIRIDGTAWAGSVEIHLTSSSWIDHGHQKDPLYNSVVLHVALYGDVWTGTLRRQDGTIMPEIVLYPRLEDPLRGLLYNFYTRSSDDPLCASRWLEVPEDRRREWIAQLADARLAERAPEAAITPVYLQGAGRVLPRGSRLFTPFNCAVIVGEPFTWCGDRKAFMARLRTAIEALKSDAPPLRWL